MRLPNFKSAIIAKEKLTEYCLNENHSVGKHKARVFKSVLGITIENVEYLIAIIYNGIANNQAIEKESDEYGKRYQVDISVQIKSEEIIIRTNRIVRNNELNPRLTSCYVKI